MEGWRPCLWGLGPGEEEASKESPDSQLRLLSTASVVRVQAAVT